MANWYVTLEFEQFQQGWTESYYFTGTNPQSVFNSLNPTFQLRMFCSPPSVLLSTVRIAQVPADGPPQARPRNGRPFHVSLPGVNLVGNPAPDLVNNACYFYLTGSGGGKRRYEMAGLPDEQTVFDANTGRSLRGPTLTPASNNYFDTLLALNGTSTRVLTPPTTTGFGYKDVVGVTGTQAVPGVGLKVTTNTPHGLANGDFVVFGKIPRKLLPNLTGNWVVTVVDADNFLIPYYTNLTSSTALTTTPMRVRKVGYALTALSRYEFVKFIKKDVGRPTNVSAGRSRGVSFRR